MIQQASEGFGQAATLRRMSTLLRLSARTSLAVALLLAAPPLPAAPCELDRPVMFAGLDWDSARLHVAIARHILERGYGCRTDSLPVTTLPAAVGVVRGDLDVLMEVWKEHSPEAWDQGLAAGEVVELGVNFPDSVQGWFVPRYLVAGDPERGVEPRAPGLRSVFDLPRYKELFRDPEEPAKGRFYNCILGWACEVVNTKKLRIYGLEPHFTNFRPGTGAALAAAIASAYKRRQPILAYYWGPTSVLGTYDLVRLEEPPYDPEVWEDLQTSDSPERATAYPPSEVVIGVHRGFYEAAPELVRFLERYETTNELVSRLLAFMAEERATEEEAARRFLRQRPEVWTRWVPAEVADRVRASLR